MKEQSNVICLSLWELNLRIVGIQRTDAKEEESNFGEEWKTGLIFYFAIVLNFKITDFNNSDDGMSKLGSCSTGTIAFYTYAWTTKDGKIQERARETCLRIAMKGLKLSIGLTIQVAKIKIF